MGKPRETEFALSRAARGRVRLVVLVVLALFGAGQLRLHSGSYLGWSAPTAGHVSPVPSASTAAALAGLPVTTYEPGENGAPMSLEDTVWLRAERARRARGGSDPGLSGEAIRVKNRQVHLFT